MKLTKSLIVLLVGTSSLMFAQTNKEAKGLLNKASEKLRSHTTLYLEFDYTFENNRVNPPVHQSESGSIALKGEVYHLNFLGTEQIRNGNKLYTILAEDEEVQVTEYDADEDQGLTPSRILSLYEKGYSYKLNGTETINGKAVQFVLLKPTTAGEIAKIRIGIIKGTNQIYSIKQWGINGTVTEFIITKHEANKSFPSNHFTFNKADYPGFYIAE